jgi:replication-associated recombination protein RarA
MPVISRFVTRDVEMQKLERLLDTEATARRRNVVILYGLGGIGKTQLAVEYGRNHKDIFSAIFWLDGSSKASLKQSFVGMAKRLPRDELTADGVDTLNDSTIDVDMAVRECLHWLSLSSNRRWLLIIDNVDRDHRDRSDAQAYDIKEYFPHADHGSILITSRLSILQTHGIGIKVGTVATEQACAILEANVGGAVDGKLISVCTRPIDL